MRFVGGRRYAGTFRASSASSEDMTGDVNDEDEDENSEFERLQSKIKTEKAQKIGL